MKAILFKKPWENKDEQVRRTAVATLNDTALRGKLPEIAQHDPSPSVRLAALKRLNSEPFWLDARRPDQDPGINEAADRALLGCATTQPSHPFEPEYLSWVDQLLAQPGTQPLLQTLARKAKLPSARQRALSGLSAQGFLADCYVDEEDPAMAATILSRIQELSTLQRVLPTLKKRSKEKAKAAQARINVLEGVSQTQALRQQALVCLAKLEQLILGQGVEHLGQEWDELQGEWESLAPHDPSLQQRFKRSKSIIELTLHPERLPTSSSPSPVTDESSLATPSMAEVDEENSRTHELPQTPVTPSEPARIEPHRPHWSEEQLDHFKSQLSSAEVAIGAGQIKEASSSLAQLPSKLPKALQSQRTHLEQELKELRRWLHWSNNEKRDEIIAQLNHASTQSMHPDAIAQLTREARAAWRALDESERIDTQDHRPVAPASKWRQFKQAQAKLNALIEPAMAQRQTYQQTNLVALDEFLSHAKSLLLQLDVSTQALIDQLNTARRSIRRLNDLPPKARGRYADELKALMASISSHLDERSEAVALAKRKLVAQAEQLAHESDPAKAIEIAKRLQTEWKAIGRGRRQTDQALWKAFRTPIDPLFETLKASREQQQAEQNDRMERFKGWLNAIETLASDQYSMDPNLRAEWTKLNDQWHSEGATPRALITRYEQARTKIQTALFTQKQAAHHQAMQRLDEYADAIQAQWHRKASGESIDTSGFEAPTRPDKALQGAWNALQTSQQAWLTNTPTEPGVQQRLDQHGQAARQVVIEMEFLCGLPSPSEDEELKKAFQVQRLSDRMNQRGQGPSLAAELEDHLVRWYQCFPMSSHQYDDLNRRFQMARVAIERMLG